MTNEDIIEEIINGITDFKVIPFVGSGLSKPCGALTWPEVIDVLREELKTTTTDFLIVAQEYEDKFGRENLVLKLKELCEIKIEDSTALEIHMKMLSMNPPYIYTTNYDSAIEKSSALLHRKYKKIVDIRDIVDSKHGEKQVIKFHGDFSKDSSIVFTKNDYEKRLNANENELDILFRSHILGKSVLFLGYSFNDDNIKYIFKKQTDLYGTANLPKSYIVSFEDNDEKENILKSQNIITLKLSSIEELNSLIDKITYKVYTKSAHEQYDEMFKPLPYIVLTKFELNNLVKYVDDTNYAEKDKSEKIRNTLEGKIIPADIENDVVSFFLKVIENNYSVFVKEAILVSFQHLGFRFRESFVKLGMELMRLTEYPEFILDLEGNNWGRDVLMIIEHKLSQIVSNTVDSRKWICIFIIAYMEGMIAENKQLSLKQVDRLLDGLKNYGYDEFDSLAPGMERQSIKTVIEFYLNKYDSELRHRFESKSIFGKRRRTASEIMEEMMKSIPKNMQ